MIGESPNMEKLKSRDIFKEICKQVEPIKSTDKNEENRPQMTVGEILADIFDE